MRQLEKGKTYVARNGRNIEIVSDNFWSSVVHAQVYLGLDAELGLTIPYNKDGMCQLDDRYGIDLQPVKRHHADIAVEFMRDASYTLVFKRNAMHVWTQYHGGGCPAWDPHNSYRLSDEAGVVVESPALGLGPVKFRKGT